MLYIVCCKCVVEDYVASVSLGVSVARWLYSKCRMNLMQSGHVEELAIVCVGFVAVGFDR